MGDYVAIAMTRAPKIDVRAALAKAGTSGIAKAISNPLTEGLRPGLKWRGAFSNSYDGNILEIVQGFFQAIFTWEISRKWDDLSPWPIEDGFAWARSIHETNATQELLFHGGAFENSSGSVKVKTGWSQKIEEALLFTLEIEHPFGSQISLAEHPTESQGQDEVPGRLVEHIGPEVVQIQWRMSLEPGKFWATVMTGLIQNADLDRISAPSFNYRIGNLRDSWAVLSDRILQHPANRADFLSWIPIGEVLTCGLVAYSPQSVIDGPFGRDLRWLMGTHTTLVPVTEKERLYLDAVCRKSRPVKGLKLRQSKSTGTPFSFPESIVVTNGDRGFNERGTRITTYESTNYHARQDWLEMAILSRVETVEGLIPDIAKLMLHSRPNMYAAVAFKDLPEIAPRSHFQCEDGHAKNQPHAEHSEVLSPVEGTMEAEREGQQIPSPIPEKLPEGTELLPALDPFLGKSGLQSASPLMTCLRDTLTEGTQHVLELVAEGIQSSEYALRLQEEEVRGHKARIEELNFRVVELEQASENRESLEAKVKALEEQLSQVSTPPAPPPSSLMVLDEDDSTITLMDHRLVVPEDVDRAGTAPLYYAKFETNVTLDEALGLYWNWILGSGDFRGVRQSRLASGVNAEWCDMPTTGTLEGTEGLQVAVRRGEGEALVRFRHRDTLPGNTWTNLARITSTSDGVQVEHGLVRTTEEGVTKPTLPGIPGVLRTLMKRAINSRPWDPIREDAEWFHEDSVQRVVAGLLDPERQTPMVIVSRSGNGSPILDGDRLAKSLQGMARVYVESTTRPHALKAAFTDAGVTDSGLWVFDGGVRVYFPGFGPEAHRYEHPLVIRRDLENRHIGDVIRGLVRSVSLRSVPNRAPSGFFGALETFDVRAAEARVAALDQHGGSEERIRAIEAQVVALNDALSQAIESAEAGQLAMRDLQQARGMSELFEVENEVLQRENREARAQNQNLMAQLTQLKIAIESARSEAREGHIPASILHDLLSGARGEVDSIVELVSAQFGDRVIFLDSALTGARDSTYKHPEEILEILQLLATDYWDGLVAGGEDPGPRVFGDTYSGRESSRLSKDGRRQRTFSVQGAPVLMERHLKLTRGYSKTTDTEVFRVHFEWFPDEKKIYVGHCGKHLPL